MDKWKINLPGIIVVVDVGEGQRRTLCWCRKLVVVDVMMENEDKHIIKTFYMGKWERSSQMKWHLVLHEVFGSERDAHAGRDTANGIRYGGNRENGSTGARARDLRFFYGVLSCYCPYVITVIWHFDASSTLRPFDCCIWMTRPRGRNWPKW
jgi:hypothetical protein